VEADISSSRASGVRFTPTFYINRRRYDGHWDVSSLVDAMLGTLGHRVRTASLDFASWGPSAGILLILATVAAIAITNSPLGPAFAALWRQELGLSLGDAAFRRSILHWVNDGLLTVFFLVVGLEVKREMTVGHLASRRSAALPMVAALGGMVVPAPLYALVIPAGDLVARVGRPDGDGHRVRDCPDRDDGRACPGRVTHLPPRGGHR
jgi:NhaA family Na+:H+ antiporter